MSETPEEKEKRLAARAERDRIMMEEAQSRVNAAYVMGRVIRRELPNGGEGYVEVNEEIGEENE